VKEPTPEEHLAQIRQVIARSKAERARSGDIYLVWGLIIVLAEAATLAGEHLGFPWGWLCFPVGLPVGVLYAAWASRRRELDWSTFGARVEGQTWMFATAAMTVLFTAGFASGLLDLRAIVPLVCSVVGLAMGSSGALFDSRMFTLSGSMFIAVAGISCFLPMTSQHLLFMAAMVLGYLGPALVLLWGERR
jgi:hypothetical protein